MSKSSLNKWMYMVGVCGLTLCTLSAAVPTGAMTGYGQQQAHVVKADSAGKQVKDDTPLTLTLHKYKSEDPDTINKQNDGLNHDDLVSGHTPLEGVRFTATKVTPKTGKTNGSMVATDSTTFDKVDGSAQHATTDADGKAAFDFGTYATGKGVYLIHEEKTSGVDEIDDFFVQMPLTKADGSGFITDVNVYPKNDTETNELNPTKTFADTNKTQFIQVGQDVSWNLSIDVPEKAYIEATDNAPALHAKALYLLDPVSNNMTAKLDVVPGVLDDAAKTKLIQGTDYTVEKSPDQNVPGYTVIKINLTPAGMEKAHGHKATFTMTTTVDKFEEFDNGVAKPILNTFDSHYVPAVGPDVPGTSNPDPKDPGKTPDPKDPTTPKDPDPKDPTDPNPDNPSVIFGRIDLTKVAEEDETTKLGGAVFKIADSLENAQNGVFIKHLNDSTAGDEQQFKKGDDIELTTSAKDDATKGTASVNGLENGKKYYLVETKAPDKYALSEEVYEVTAAPDTTTDATVKDQKDIVQEYLPLTGGQLRLVLMATGSVMILAFGTALYIKKRREA